jgi:hypothetical protein
MRFPRLAASLLLLHLGWAAGAQAQVMVAPTALFTSKQVPFATLLVANRSNEPQEVAIDFRFGYPASDSLGDLYMAYGDSLDAARFSMDSWVRAFPRRFVLGPGQEQVVRVIARPPADIEEGTYWSRLVVTSSGRAPAITAAGEASSAQVMMRIEQVTAVLYRNGRLSTAIDIGDPQVHSDSAATTVRVPLGRGGNSPFLGRIRVQVFNAEGVPVAETQEYFAVYVDLTKRISLPPLSPGDYTVEITVSPTRPDIPRENLVQMPDAVRKKVFQVSPPGDTRQGAAAATMGRSVDL